MAYEKQNFVDDEVLDASQLNHMEDGIADAVSVNKQTLTEEQKAQARENIEATTIEDVTYALEGNLRSESLIDDVTWAKGFVTWGNINTTGAMVKNGIVYAKAPNLDINTTYVAEFRILASKLTAAHFIVCTRNVAADGTNSTVENLDKRDVTSYTYDGNLVVCQMEFTLTKSYDEVYLSFETFVGGDMNTEEDEAKAVEWAKNNAWFFRKKATTSRILPLVNEEDNEKVAVVKDGNWTVGKPDVLIRASANPNIKSINHRGYNTIAPENTLSAYRLSKKMGFDMVECDVSFTSDGHAVLLHDTTIDRTSNGTGAINELTFEYVRSLDFGGWKSADYAGELIPTFEEFTALCRNIGLYPYIEIKSATQGQVEGLVATVKKYGMLEKVTWITAYGKGILEYVRNKHESARLGLVVNTVTESAVTACNELKNGKNEVFINAAGNDLTNEIIASCQESDIPLEVWAVGNGASIVSANSYISGFTTDAVIAGVVLYESAK